MKKISNKILYIIAALAAFLLVISAFASERPIGFPDVPVSSCYYDAVTYFAGKGVVSGQEDGQFHPDDILTSDEWSGILDSVYPSFPRPSSTPSPISSASVYQSIWAMSGEKTYAVKEYGFDSDLDAGTTAMVVTGLIHKDDVRHPTVTRGEALRLLYEVVVKKSVAVPSSLADCFSISIAEDCDADSEQLVRSILAKFPNNQLALMLAYKYSVSVLSKLPEDSAGHTERLGYVDEGQHIIYLKESGISQALAHEVGHVIEACNVSYSKTWELNKMEGSAAVSLMGKYAGKNANEFIAESTRYFIENAGNETAMTTMQKSMPKTYEHLTSVMNADPILNESQFLTLVYGD